MSPHLFVLNSGLGEVECSSNMCLSSGARVLEGLLSTLIHEVKFFSGWLFCMPTSNLVCIWLFVLLEYLNILSIICAYKIKTLYLEILYYHDEIQVDVLQSLDSGIDTSEENDNDDTPFEDTHLDSDKFSLCSSCTSSIPKVAKTFPFSLQK